jgi:farnesyl diphosphate synthase
MALYAISTRIAVRRDEHSCRWARHFPGSVLSGLDAPRADPGGSDARPLPAPSLDGGKRVRPLLTYAAGELTDAAPQQLEVVASAVELIHNYSLVHDDLPCMDDDVLRRGRPTCHVEYDQATALLVGDSLQSLAFELLSRDDFGDSSRQLEMVRLLARASGSSGMAGGQSIDLESVGRSLNQPELELMHTLKTGALIRAAVLLGGLCGKALSDPERESLDRFAKRAGLLFQVVDDILDCTASTATLGKTAGKDAAAQKPTYVSLMGLERAREFAVDLRTQALESLSIFGGRSQRLFELTDFISQRKF